MTASIRLKVVSLQWMRQQQADCENWNGNMEPARRFFSRLKDARYTETERIYDGVD